MQNMLDQGLRDGAVGLSIGLEYFPGRYAGPSELEGLAALLKGYDGLFATHTRGISALFNESMTEAITVAEHAGCRLQLAHVNPMGPDNWGAIDNLFALVEAGRGRGLDVGYDIVAYVMWTVSVIDILPYFVQDLGLDAILALAATVDGRSALRQQIEDARPLWPPWIGHRVTRNVILEFGWDALLVADPASPQFEADRGKSLGAIARARGKDPYDVYFDLILASGGRAQIVNVGYGGNFEDDTPLRRLMARPDAIVETDTVPTRKPDGNLYLNLPLFYGTMARFLGHFSRDLGLTTLEQAVHRITELPARRLRLRDRGVLRVGAFADITVFDPATVGDRGTHLDPQPAAGIVHVFVNGQPVVRDGVYDPERLPGRVLRRDA
jgi:N-acyl-D-aspartate/D-glutamate deacylase